MFSNIVQKTCIWINSLSLFGLVSYWSMQGHSNEVTIDSLLSILVSMCALALSMFIAERWMAIWKKECVSAQGRGKDGRGKEMEQKNVKRT